ncbi:putative leucine-rich repeat receptor-like serine/threonine-protein kinase At2g19230 [Rhododendron vialii]|uniref:putative leucine-rich repeat receptor-like serine/threonine-protein kinase At2g19230 n=1 Tax=Rhododendron vialii TaxID=182163 RepID=UPI00265F150F|nr:putative leucine-rich repeat receptor-like serine/threonine-protein kinase At2g19230 [Rhododendron vialii]
MTQLSRTMKLFMLYGCLTLVLLVHGQDQSGFKSIDCGISEGSDYKDKETTIFYISDAGYIDTGTNRMISSDYISADSYRRLSSLRSFPDGIKNCYTFYLAQAGGDKYLIRASFKYGNYDSNNQPPEFALYLDGDHWHTIRFKYYPSDDYVRVEIIHNVPATTAYIHVCLVNIRLGTPFISALELRQLNNFIYQTNSGSLKLFNRIDVGSTTKKTVRYTDDVYDRIWLPDTVDQEFASSAWEVFNASHDKSDALSSNDYKPPYPVMATAVRPVNGRNSLNFSVDIDYPTQQLYVYMHFAEIETIAADQKREFDIYINDDPWILNVTTDFLQPTTNFSTYVLDADLRQMNFSIRATEESTLPPILNAFELYEVLELTSPTPTNQSEVEAIRNIKSAYGVERNWQGDPCVPMNYSWDNLQCNYDRNSTRIISLNLSSSSLSGNMNFSFSGLTSLESLDLSNNNLIGPVPDFLSELPSLKTLNLSRNNFTGSIPPALVEKSKIGSLTLSTEGNPHLCQVDSCAKKKNFVVPTIASIASCLVIVAVILAIWWSLKRRKQQEGRTLKPKNQRFTYSEVVTITNNFERVIGKGGFGTVYLGHLEDGTEVAVKMLSRPLSQGSEQFWTEAELLTTIHHRNVASLIGYCDQGTNTALLYEYMSNGNLKECLLDQNRAVLTWKQRLQIAIDAAQALEYLHNGCKPPIIHRDIKTTNILLTENLQAKVADFGLSRIFPVEDGSHVSTGVVGTFGYLDPEYYITSRLTEKSDVYSFGVVLLELITGQPAVIKSEENPDHIVQWVMPMLERGEINSIADPRLQGDFDSNSVWKALETAIACVPSRAIQRLSMSQVLGELNACLEIYLASGGTLEISERSCSGIDYSRDALDLESSMSTPQAR